MRIKNITFFSLLMVGSVLVAFRGITDESKNEVLMKLVVQGLNSSHYAPGELDDDFSTKVYDLFLKRMDYNKRYFTQGDIAKLSPFETRIDEQVQAQEFEFFDLSEQLLRRRIEQVKDIYKSTLIQPFDYTVDETIDLDVDNRTWAKDEAELKERWRKLLKWQVLSRLNTKLTEQEKAVADGKEDVEEKDFETLEEEARAKVMKNYDDWARRMDKVETKDRRNMYINVIANTYDPHTSYYPPKDKENFDIQMSGKLEGIGATLQEKDGFIKVVRIVPGSASYRQGELKADDIILKVGQGAEEPVDIEDMRLDDAVKLIRGKKGTEVRLTVKKADGEITEIPIIRDVVILEETFARSAVIKNKNVKNGVGYIKLPKFYADFNNKNGRSCARDVRKEIEKLKTQNVDGIVLDLRNNGGGSLMDVVQMAGLFIDKGPIVQVKGRYGRPQILEDKDENIQYDGPLVVMVNSSSASASEILAAAIQDYKRGIVLGTPTFGKGTVQRFFDLDNFIRGEANEIKPLGAIKLTTQKFYRINGGATQLKGVIPDVVLPDSYTYIDRGEKEQDYSMPWDEIAPANYKAGMLNSADYSRIRKNSRARVQNHPMFAKVDENAKRLKRQRDMKTRSLNFDTFRADEKRFKEEAKQYKDMFTAIEGTEIVNLPTDLAKINSDTVRQQMNEEWIESVQKDIYIDEAIAVIKDQMK